MKITLDINADTIGEVIAAFVKQGLMFDAEQVGNYLVLTFTGGY